MKKRKISIRLKISFGMILGALIAGGFVGVFSLNRTNQFLLQKSRQLPNRCPIFHFSCHVFVKFIIITASLTVAC